MGNRIFLFLTALLILAGQNLQAEHQASRTEPLVIAVNEPGSDIKIPSQILKLSDGEINNLVGTFSFFSMKVRLREKNSGVLKAPEILFEFPKGGGDIDFSTYLGEVPGTFYVNFEFDVEKEDQLKVFYVSKARKRKLEDGIWGVGCKKFLDITSYYRSETARQGFKVNTTRNRHNTLMGGHFIFSLNNGKRLILSQVSFKDTKSPDLFCDSSGAE